MAASPFTAALKQVPVDLKDIFIAVGKPGEITAKLRRELRRQKRAADRILASLEAAKDTKQNEMNGLIAAWRPSRRYHRIDRRKLAIRTLQLGVVETFVNGIMLYTASFKGGLLASVAASVLPSLINLGAGAFLGDILLRHIRRENANRTTRILSWKGICVLLSLAVSVNTGFAYLRMTGSLEGILQHILTARIDYTIPAISALGMMLFAWSTMKWWYSAHPNLQIEKLGRELEEFEIKISCNATDLEAGANAAVSKAADELDRLEEQEGADIRAANDEFGDLVVIITGLCQKLDAFQSVYEEVTNDYSRMIFDALGSGVPDHYKQSADLEPARPDLPDLTTLKALIHRLECDFGRLRENIAAARRELALEPDRTMGWPDTTAFVPIVEAGAAGGASNFPSQATLARKDAEDIVGVPATVHRDAAE